MVAVGAWGEVVFDVGAVGDLGVVFGEVVFGLPVFECGGDGVFFLFGEVEGGGVGVDVHGFYDFLLGRLVGPFCGYLGLGSGRYFSARLATSEPNFPSELMQDLMVGFCGMLFCWLSLALCMWLMMSVKVFGLARSYVRLVSDELFNIRFIVPSFVGILMCPTW